MANLQEMPSGSNQCDMSVVHARHRRQTDRRSTRGGKDGFLRLWFFLWFFKKPKNLERSDFLVFYGFFRYCYFFV